MAKPLFRNIIVAFNGTKQSVHAAMYGILMAKTYHLSIKFVYVVDTATMAHLALSKFLTSDERKDFDEQLTADGKRHFNYVKRLAQKHNVEIETEMRRGSVAIEIISAAEDFSADMILVGMRDIGASAGISTQSTGGGISALSVEIMAKARCPVLCVRKADIEDLFQVF